MADLLNQIARGEVPALFQQLLFWSSKLSEAGKGASLAFGLAWMGCGVWPQAARPDGGARPGEAFSWSGEAFFQSTFPLADRRRGLHGTRDLIILSLEHNRICSDIFAQTWQTLLRFLAQHLPGVTLWTCSSSGCHSWGKRADELCLCAAEAPVV